MGFTQYRNDLLFLTFYFLILTSCSVQKQISKSATAFVLKDSSLTTAHVGISIYEPATSKYWYNYQGDHYFVPASNTKIATCYAAMKYLEDSLVGLRYTLLNDTTIVIKPTGDPSLLHSDFPNQSVIDFLISTKKQIIIDFKGWQDNALGSGWAWNDYNEPYMAERSIMPMYGNLVTVNGTGSNWTFSPSLKGKIVDDTAENNGDKYLSKVIRERASNVYHITFDGTREKTLMVPFNTENPEIISKLLHDMVETKVTINNGLEINNLQKFNAIHSQPTDSLLKPMMHRSDNFFAEQTLFMVSNELLGVMNDEKIIDTLLKTDFKDLPQKPRWVDGSGLSRYNLFSPKDFVAIFNKMKTDFRMERIRNIFPTGNEGTLTNYYKSESGFIFAKTGTLSGVVSLSGFLYTRKNRLLIFSVLVNNHNSSATAVRKAVEKFIEGIRNKY
jgi:D-alanyl-D-alanine carboxypeptidase/D-alanyl-D-alanine-endopeptidase (penicillin-binding protein 4)